MTTLNAPLSLKEKQRLEREALILQAAEEVLLEKGYYETSMDEIAARVGIAKGTIYSHFPGKEELVLAIFTRDLQKFITEIDPVLASQSSPLAKLEALIDYIYTGFYSKQARLLSSMYSGADLKKLIEAKHGCMRDLWDTIINHVSTLLEEGKVAGEFNADIPTSVMTYSFFGLFSFRVYDNLLLRDRISHDALIIHLKHIYFAGIRSKNYVQQEKDF